MNFKSVGKLGGHRGSATPPKPLLVK